jgi:hypothetical protein
VVGEPALPTTNSSWEVRVQRGKSGSARLGRVDQPEQSPEPRPEQIEIGRRTYVFADVEPLDVDGIRTLAVGTILWLLAFLVLLPFHDRLEQAGRDWWLWTCLAGFGVGVLGWEYCRRRRNRRHQNRLLPTD